jgi:hypothetical protein
MNYLFRVLDGIMNSDYTDEILNDVNEILNYGDATLITRNDAQLIQTVGKNWIIEQESGDWSVARHNAMSALEQE